MHCNVATRSAIELSDTNDAYNTVVWCEYVGVVIRYDVRAVILRPVWIQLLVKEVFYLALVNFRLFTLLWLKISDIIFLHLLLLSSLRGSTICR